MWSRKPPKPSQSLPIISLPILLVLSIRIGIWVADRTRSHLPIAGFARASLFPSRNFRLTFVIFGLAASKPLRSPACRSMRTYVRVQLEGEFYCQPADAAAKLLQMPPSTLSRSWRRANGSARWPYRTLLRIDRQIEQHPELREQLEATARQLREEPKDLCVTARAFSRSTCLQMHPFEMQADYTQLFPADGLGAVKPPDWQVG